MKNPLTAERLRELLDYDPTTGEFTWKVKVARRVSIGGIAGSIGTKGYRLISVESIKYNAHRLAWLHTHGIWPDGDIDHVNGVKADNRMENLRCATRSQNNANSITRKNSTGFRGVYFYPKTGRYQAHIQQKHLGYFATAEEASEVYKKAAAETFGEFVRPLG